VLTPFEAGAERVARPFRDAWGWASDVLAAKGENEDLKEQLEAIRQAAIENDTAAAENEELRALLKYRDGPRFPTDFRAVTTRVIVEPQSAFRQEVVLAAGESSGVRVNDPVVTSQGLVGIVVATTSNAANVRLLTDQESAASAYVPRTGAGGVVRRGASTSAALQLDRVPKDEEVAEGDTVVTAGTQSGSLESLYPRGIPVCSVTSVSQRDIDSYKQIQCTPLVDFDGVHSVIVLVAKGGR
jgi:rod shape-determining protein MreC